MSYNLQLRVVIYLQLIFTIFIYYMAILGLDNLSGFERELVFTSVLFGVAAPLVVLFTLFQHNECSWKRFLFVSMAFLACSIELIMCYVILSPR